MPGWVEWTNVNYFKCYSHTFYNYRSINNLVNSYAYTMGGHDYFDLPENFKKGPCVKKSSRKYCAKQ